MESTINIGLEPRQTPNDYSGTRIISVANYKGGQGKTTIAANYARYVGGAYLTNENSKRIKAILSACIPESRYFYLGDERSHYVEILKKALPKANGHIVFDFGGYADRRLSSIIANSDLVVIPFRYSGDLDLGVFIETIETFRSWNAKKVIIVINDTDTYELPDVKETLNKLYGDKYPIKVVRRSRIARRLIRPGQLIDDAIVEKGAQARSLTVFRDQLIDVFETIETLLKGGR